MKGTIKKIVSIMLVIALCMPLFGEAVGNTVYATSETEETYTTLPDNLERMRKALVSDFTDELYDIDGNHKVNIVDLIRLKKMLVNTINADYATDFTVSRVFSNNMVVQRNEKIRVWGFAEESENGKKVSGEFKGMFAEALIENGEWCITFEQCLDADTNGASMKIYTNTKEVIFSDVLVGDVYMVVGQSNAEYFVDTHISNTDAATQGGGKEGINPDSIIRLNRTANSSGGNFSKRGTDYVYKDLLNTKQWTKTTEADTLEFSALGYYFAKNLVEKTDGKIPVGVIEVAFSGAPLGSFLPNEIAERYNTDTLNADTGKFVTTGVNSGIYPGRWIYNCHLAPFEKYAIAGLVWYQGESNNTLDEAVKYNEVFTALMSYMRSTHNIVNRDFPVFITEFPSIYNKPANYTGSETWHFMELGIIRSYMGTIPTILENSHISVSSDLWTDKSFANSLHPNCKFEQSERLASIANTVVCGNGTLSEAAGPVYNSVNFSDDQKTVTVTLTNVGQGLITKDGGTDVEGIVGLSKNSLGHTEILSPTSAKITSNDQITLTFDTAVKSVAYNYNSSDLYGETLNLCNSYGIPASAFITPYTDREISDIAADDFKDKDESNLGAKRHAIDAMRADGTDLFTLGYVESELLAANNKVDVEADVKNITTIGWIGFEHKIFMFGYSIDGGNAIFNTYPSNAEDAVKNLAGPYASRFSIDVDISNLPAGEHTITLLALLDFGGDTAVRLLTFDILK